MTGLVRSSTTMILGRSAGRLPMKSHMPAWLGAGSVPGTTPGRILTVTAYLSIRKMIGYMMI